MPRYQRPRPLKLLLALVLLAGAALLLAPGASSVYTWPGAKMVKVEVSPLGSGWVRSIPYYIDCPSECERPFDANQSTTVVANPTPGFTFVGWEVRPAGSTVPIPNACPGTGFCAVATDADKTIVAKFEGSYRPLESDGEGGSDGCCRLKVVNEYGGEGLVIFDEEGFFTDEPIECPEQCVKRFSRGETADLASFLVEGEGGEPYPGDWYLNGDLECSDTPFCSFPVNRNSTVRWEPSET